MRHKMTLVLCALLVVLVLACLLMLAHLRRFHEDLVTVYSVGDMVNPALLEEFQKKTHIRVTYCRLDEAVDHPLSLSDCDLLLGELPLLELMDQYDQLMTPDPESLQPPQNLAASYRGAAERGTSGKAVPALWTTMGLLHDSAASGVQVTSWNDLFDPGYPGTVMLNGSVQKSLSCAMMAVHGDITSPSPEQQLHAALALMRLERTALVSRSVGSLDAAFRSGAATLAPCYAGQAIELMNDMPDLSFVRPTEGSWQTLLAYAIPSSAAHPRPAVKLMNYLCRTENMAKNAAYSGWSTPSLAAFRMLSKSWQRNPLAYSRSGLARLNMPPLLEYHRQMGAYLFP